MIRKWTECTKCSNQTNFFCNKLVIGTFCKDSLTRTLGLNTKGDTWQSALDLKTNSNANIRLQDEKGQRAKHNKHPTINDVCGQFYTLNIQQHIHIQHIFTGISPVFRIHREKNIPNVTSKQVSVGESTYLHLLFEW